MGKFYLQPAAQPIETVEVTAAAFEAAVRFHVNFFGAAYVMEVGDDRTLINPATLKIVTP